jgi:4-hydroxythreonine-4-phosphate dehydrogenase
MPTSPTDKRPAICITTGDPRGIGPEVVRKALESNYLKGKAQYLIFTDHPRIKKNNPDACAASSLDSINRAFNIIINGKADALVTGPVCKEAISKAGIPAGLKFEGHTEYLAGLSGSERFAMMFISKRLKVSLVTRHVPLSRVSAAISIKGVCDTVELTRSALKDWFGVKNPRIGVAGLNPHCGEGGRFGKEERITIRPAIKRLQGRYPGVYGPIPADALLYDAYHKKYDAAVCMYHDQGLPAFKMVSRDDGVNLTLGLPFIRTSPDHGTAFDIARKGIADPGSMIEAIRLAIKLTKRADRLRG